LVNSPRWKTSGFAGGLRERDKIGEQEGYPTYERSVLPHPYPLPLREREEVRVKWPSIRGECFANRASIQRTVFHIPESQIGRAIGADWS
jgi:hypothetical protein